ncbi:MAG: hypothetical protein J7L62_07370 [Candidatus Aminicenantes bacterium]|nr:hypothetical protein [Candidatus Aminicenantes bacterium]
MKILFAILLAIQEAIIGTSSLGPVSILETKWVKEIGLVKKDLTLKETAELIVLARLSFQRYQGSFDIKDETINPFIKKARELGLPDSFSIPLIKGFILLEKIKTNKFGNRESLFQLWKQNELRRQNFRFIFNPQ